MTAGETTVGFSSDVSARWVDDEARVELIGMPPGRAAMDRLDLRPGQRVLDVGCGAGATTVELAQRTSPGGYAVGVDASVAMIDAARRRTSLAGVEFVHADAQRVELAPASFDRVFSRFGVMFFDDPTAAFANLHQALRHTGRLAFVAWQDLEHNDWMRLPAAAAAAVVDAPVPLPVAGRPGPFAFSQPRRIRDVLEAAGFEAIECRSVNDHVELCVADASAYAAGSMGHGGIRTALQHADEDTETRVLHAIAEGLRALAEDGMIRLSRGTHVVTARPSPGAAG